MIKFHLIYSTVLLVSIYLITWSKFEIVRIKKQSLIKRIKNHVNIIVMTYLPIINIIMLIVLLMLISLDDKRALELANRNGVEFRLKDEGETV